MCGIVGLIDTPWQDQIGHALETLTSRGPDARAIFEEEGVALGHARLSVIDLSGGHQPMISPDGRYALVFNGEIYNFLALKADLEVKGFQFRTRSDTEVILHGFAAWGQDLPTRLDGMFAYAIWDRCERTLSAARDRIGIKPFFYAARDGFSFASTLAPFACLRSFPDDPDWSAVRDYLAFQTCLAPNSFFASVSQLPPASRLKWDAASHHLEVERYWNIPWPGELSCSQGELVERVDSAIAESVRAQMVADVPLGAFLSGGIDSGLMVRYMAETVDRPIETFSMKFEQDGFDESIHAKEIAREFGCKHHVLEAPAIDADRLLTAIRALDQPLADAAYVMTFALSELTRKYVTVAISGDGGDELFAGYQRYSVTEHDFPRRPGQRWLRRATMNGWLPGGLLRRGLWGQERMLYRQVEAGPWPVSRKSLDGLLAPEFVPRFDTANTMARWKELALSFGGSMDTASLMRADLWTYLSENCLAKTDRGSMAHGLEVRVPLLGNAVLDEALRLPAETHFDDIGGKAILRQLARKYLPESTWNRPKHGFSVPLRILFAGPWQDLGDELFSRANRIAPFLNSVTARNHWRRARAGHGNPRLTYSLFVLLAWLDSRSPAAPGLERGNPARIATRRP